MKLFTTHSLAVALALSVAPMLSAQSFAGHAAGNAGTGTKATPTSIKSMPNMPDKLIDAQIRDGVLTIDGMVAKVHLDYAIKNAGYIYVFLPGTGTAIVSLSNMPNATYVKGAFNGSTLTFAADGHTFQITTQGKLLSEDAAKSAAFVSIDRTTPSLDRYPIVGYGNKLNGPYEWPGSNPEAKSTTAETIVPPPPVPVNLLPKMTTTTVAVVTKPSIK